MSVSDFCRRVGNFGLKTSKRQKYIIIINMKIGRILLRVLVILIVSENDTLLTCVSKRRAFLYQYFDNRIMNSRKIGKP